LRKITVFLVSFLIFSAYCFPQQGRDSLKALHKQTVDYLSKYNYLQSIEGGIKLIEEAKKSGDDYYQFLGHNILGNAYTDIQDTARARRNYTLALQFAESTQNDTLLITAYNNLGNIYSEVPATADEGIAYYNRGIAIAEKLNLPEEGLFPKINIAWTYLDNGKHDLAYPYLEESLEMLGEREDNYVRSNLYMLLGRYFVKKNQQDSAKTYYREALYLAETDSLILQASEVSKNFAELLFNEAQFKEAYTTLEKHNEYNSQIFEKDRLEQIEAANARFDLNEYQKNLEIAKNEQLYQERMIRKSNEVLILMLISSLVLLVILVALNKINRDRRKLIRELKEKNQQLLEAKEQAERLSVLKTRFFSTVSHELRTPLYGVVGLTTLLMEDESLAKHKNDLKSLKFSADYLLALINDVLQMNKMESNLVKLEKMSFDLRELILSIVNTFEFSRIQNKNELHFHIDEEIPQYLIGDKVRLSQVLMNLVGNAMKFTERGNISITAKLVGYTGEKAQLYFEVKDDGLGIPESKQQVIFEEFSQLRSANYNYQGTGLGLPIVKKLLELFDSEIHLESKEGEGSRFYFSIDFKIDQSPKMPDLFDEQLVTEGGESARNILIVDDNRINQVVTCRILEKQNFNCSVAKDGLEAIDKAREQEFDLILMDVNMPGINGLEATRKIREFNEEVPVVALTAVEIDEIRNKIYRAGMNDIIVKPYDVQQFYQIVYRNLNLHLVRTEEN
jgi:signal transduction histidine kinase/ActR/RegA family two-component response regulator